jgi:hypothetical protein
MALQTKTFSWGSFNYGSESNAYKLELTLTENSVDQAKNLSNISYALVLKSGSSNRFDGQIDSVIEFNGVQIASGSKQISKAYNASWILLEGTADVTHNQDGNLEMPVVVSINTYNPYAPPDKTLNWSWQLTPIPRASNISSAATATLGERCKITWVPNSRAFRYRIEFSIGEWYRETELLHPNKTTANTYNGLVLPMEVAEQITDNSIGQMRVVLTTYSDPNGTDIIGTDEAKMTVIVPQNEATVPVILSAYIKPVKAFNGMYLQGRTQVKGSVIAEGRLGATVTATMTVSGKTYSSPWLSDPVTASEDVKITVTDSRGFVVSESFPVEVVAYYPPSLVASAVRCKADGSVDNAGTYLLVQAATTYAPLNGENDGYISYQYKAEGAKDYSDAEDIAANVSSGQKVTAVIGGNFVKEKVYQLQIIAEDQTGERTVVPIKIPSEAVYLDKPPGGKRLGIGGYCDGVDQLIDVHFAAMLRNGVVIGHGVGSIYLTVTDENPAERFGGSWKQLESLVGYIKVWRKSS